MGDSDIDTKNISNTPAPDISYFTPYQNPPAGQAANPQSNGSAPPKLFQPLKIRGLTLHNRIGVSKEIYINTRLLIADMRHSLRLSVNIHRQMAILPTGTWLTLAALRSTELAL